MSDDLDRRDFLKIMGMGAAGINAWAMSSSQANAALRKPIPGMGLRIGSVLKVQPVLMYHLYERKEATTWREWGGLKTQSDVDAEVARIEKELRKLCSEADFAIEVLPLMQVNEAGKAAAARDSDCDVVLIYAAGAGGKGIYKREWLETIADCQKYKLMFLRHKSGPVYLWYEIGHPVFLRKATDEYKRTDMDVWDVVVDDYGEVLWRLRSLYGLKNTSRTKIVAIGGAGGWGIGGKIASENAKKYWGIDIQPIEHDELKSRIQKAHKVQSTIEQARREADKYLAEKSIVSVRTDRKFIVNAFILKNIFKELMAEAGAAAVTVNGCMGIGPTAQTTACLSFSVINDEGLMAFCESDFVVIPSGILLRYISGKPAFLNDPTHPHNGVTTCAHCTAPRRMNGKDCEPVEIHTHFESDYGAAPKVNMRTGQTITNLIPNFRSTKWMGFRGKITEHPFYDICRSQIDLEIEGDWRRLLEDMQGFHWMTCYGDYLREVGYALKKVGIQWDNLSEEKRWKV